MRILLDITHPAHLHFFRYAIERLRDEGHTVLLTTRRKDCLAELSAELGLVAESFGGNPQGVVKMAGTLVYRKWRLLKIARRFRPDVMAASAGTFIASVGRLLGVPTIVFSDTESATLSNRITYPLATRICLPRAYLHANVPRSVRYDGYHELAYLHPEVFTPDLSVLDELGVEPGERYTILRLVGWAAGHDVGRRGLNLGQKRAVVDRLAKLGRVFISAEGPLRGELEDHRFPLPPHRMHDALAFASLLFGESSTMSSEAGMLGVPSVFVYPRVELGITQEQAERWRIVHWFTPQEFEGAVTTAERILRDRNTSHWQKIGRRITADCENVSDFICRQILEFDPEPRRAA